MDPRDGLLPDRRRAAAAARWQRLLPRSRRSPIVRVLAYLLIGYLANNILPARLGELVRCHYVGEREGFPRATALGTVVVERVVDIAVVVSIARWRSSSCTSAASSQARSSSASRWRGCWWSGSPSGSLPTDCRALTGSRRSPSAGPAFRELGRRLRDGLAVIRRPRALGEAWASASCAWGATLLAVAAAGQSIGLELTIGQAALLASGVALATAIPSAPGYLGTFELAFTTIGKALGLPADEAFALGFIVHVEILLLTSIGGAIAFIRLGWQRSVHEVGEVAHGLVEGDDLIDGEVRVAPAPSSADGPPR